MNPHRIDALIDDLLVEADVRLRTAMEYLAVFEEEQIVAKAERLERLRAAIRKAEAAILEQEERVCRAADADDAQRSRKLLASFRQTLANFRLYERRCQEAPTEGPALPVETRRAYASFALGVVFGGATRE